MPGGKGDARLVARGYAVASDGVKGRDEVYDVSGEGIRGVKGLARESHRSQGARDRVEATHGWERR